MYKTKNIKFILINLKQVITLNLNRKKLNYFLFKEGHHALICTLLFKSCCP